MSQINAPIQINDSRIDTWVYPNDWIVGDMNGVVCIPQQLLPRILEMMPAQVQAEDRIAEDLANGKSFAASSKFHRQNL